MTDKIYVSLCTIFSILVVLSNLVYQKFVVLNLWTYHTFELSAGAILYPTAFLITDLITEFFDKQKAKFCVTLGICINIMVAFIILGVDLLPATSWSMIDTTTFHSIFAAYTWTFIGSTLACYISQILDVMIYIKIRKTTDGKYVWLRSCLSTGISLFIDTMIVMVFFMLFGVMPREQVLKVIMHSYTFKLLFVVLSMPAFCGAFYWIKWIIRNDKDKLSEIVA